MSFVEWQKKYNISAVIIRPDRHVYGCCDNHTIIQKIDKLSIELHNNINNTITESNEKNCSKRKKKR